MIFEINLSRIDVRKSPCQGNFIYFISVGDIVDSNSEEPKGLHEVLRSTFFYFTEVKPFLSEILPVASEKVVTGQLNLAKRLSPKYGNVYTILDLELLGDDNRILERFDVEARAFRLHAGNRVKDTKGCIVPVRKPTFGQFDSRTVADDFSIGVDSGAVTKVINSYSAPITFRFYDIYEVLDV